MMFKKSAAPVAPASPQSDKADKSKNGLRGARRRLSVVSDNKLIEGVATLGAVDHEDVLSSTGSSVVKSYAGVSKKGYAPYNPRKRNQDAILMEEHRPTGTLLFGVFDGHGEAGDHVSHYFSERLLSRLPGNRNWLADPGTALADEVDRLEKLLLVDTSIDTEFSGTTAVIATIRNRTLTVANVGDSRCIVGRLPSSATAADGEGGAPRSAAMSTTTSPAELRRGSITGSAAAPAARRGSMAPPAEAQRLVAVEITSDHKPDRPDEERRILSRGGRVFAVEYEDGIDGPPRVWLGHMDIPGLAMSRSLGDTVAHTAGVSSEPELSVIQLEPEDRVVVIASDGLWEFMSNQEVIDMIAGIDDPRKAVDVLVAEANARWMKEEQVIDDTSVIVAFLQI